MISNSYQSNYENAKKCVQALKNNFQPIQFGSNNKLISQEQCLKLLRSLALKELQDIAQQEKEDKLRFKEQSLYLEKRKSSIIKEDETQEDLEIIKIKKIKKNEISDINKELNIVTVENKEELNDIEDESSTQFLSSYNNIQIQYFEQCFHSQLLSMIYSNFNRPSSDIAKLFHSLNSVSDVFKHLKTIYKNQKIIVNQQTKIFEETFGYVAENIILEKEEFVNDIIKDHTSLKSFIEETKIRTEQLYLLLSRVVQHEYRQDVQKFKEKEFSPLLKLFTDICTSLSKEELRVAFKHYIKINHRISLLENAVRKFEKPIQGENLLKEAFNEKLYLLKNQSLDSNESDHISSFLAYMVFRINALFEDLFESFQLYSLNVQNQIMDILTRDTNKEKIKKILYQGQQPFLPILLSVFEFICQQFTLYSIIDNSYLLQVFIFDLLIKSEVQLIDENETQRILEQLKMHVNQTQNIFDFYKKFPDFYDEQIIIDYKNIKDLQDISRDKFREKYSFLPESRIQSTHLILIQRFLQEDSKFINRENMGEFVSYFIEKVDRDAFLDYIMKLVQQEKQNLNTLIILFLLKLASQAISEQNENHEHKIQNIILEMCSNRVWLINNSILSGLKIYLKDLCTPEQRAYIHSRINEYFSTQLQGKTLITQFDETFEFS